MKDRATAARARTSVAILTSVDDPTPVGLHLDFDDVRVVPIDGPPEAMATRVGSPDHLVVHVPADPAGDWASALEQAASACPNGTPVLVVPAPDRGGDRAAVGLGASAAADGAALAGAGSRRVPLSGLHLREAGATFALAGEVDAAASLTADELTARLRLIAQVQRATADDRADDTGHDEVARLSGELARTRQELQQVQRRHDDLSRSRALKAGRKVAALRQTLARDDRARALFSQGLRARRTVSARAKPVLDSATRRARANRTVVALAGVGLVGAVGVVVADLEDPRTQVAVEAGQAALTMGALLGIRSLLRRSAASERRVTARLDQQLGTRLDALEDRQVRTATASLAASADLQGQMERLSAEVRRLATTDDAAQA